MLLADTCRNTSRLITLHTTALTRTERSNLGGRHVIITAAGVLAISATACALNCASAIMSTNEIIDSISSIEPIGAAAQRLGVMTDIFHERMSPISRRSHRRSRT
jgi:hypothetical protein